MFKFAKFLSKALKAVKKVAEIVFVIAAQVSKLAGIIISFIDNSGLVL